MDSKQPTPDRQEPDGLTMRLRYARSEPAIWLAHLDLMRTFERSIRRAGLPVAYSKGFNPRPQLAFALPIGVGLATRDDYVDVSLTEPVAAPDLMTKLNRSLPAGLAILAAVPVSEQGPSLMSLIRAADYELQGPGLAPAARRLLALPAGTPWLTEKNSKGKMITVDIQPLLISLEIIAEDRLLARVRAGSKENLRPDLLLAVLTSLGGLDPIAAGDTSVNRRRLLVADEADPARLKSPLQLPDEG